MKTITVQVVLMKDHRVLFKTEPMPLRACEDVYEELKDKFRMKMFDIKILKKTTYLGYAKLETINNDKDSLF